MPPEYSRGRDGGKSVRILTFEINRQTERGSARPEAWLQRSDTFEGRGNLDGLPLFCKLMS
jgi:hypothetical protein